MGDKIDVPARRAKRREVGERRLRAWQQHEIAIAGQRPSGSTRSSATPGSAASGSRSSEIGDPGQARNGDAESAFSASWPAKAVEGDAVLRRKLAGCREERHDAERDKAGVLANGRKGPVEEPYVAAELVDDDTLGAAPATSGARRAWVPTSDAMTPPRSNVADQHDRHVGGLGKAHIWRWQRPRRRLTSAGAAGAFDEDDCGGRSQPREALEDARHEGRLEVVVVPRLSPTSGSAAWTMIFAPASDLRALSSTGFMSVSGATPQARACSALGRARSRPPPASRRRLFDMFCGLNGRTLRPRRVKARARPATSSDFPTLRARALAASGPGRGCGGGGHWPARALRSGSAAWFLARPASRTICRGRQLSLP